MRRSLLRIVGTTTALEEMRFDSDVFSLTSGSQNSLSILDGALRYAGGFVMRAGTSSMRRGLSRRCGDVQLQGGGFSMGLRTSASRRVAIFHFKVGAVECVG